jgi:hypothetical protein
MLSAVSTGGANVGELSPLETSVGGVDGRDTAELDAAGDVGVTLIAPEGFGLIARTGDKRIKQWKQEWFRESSPKGSVSQFAQ